MGCYGSTSENRIDDKKTTEKAKNVSYSNYELKIMAYRDSIKQKESKIKQKMQIAKELYSQGPTMKSDLIRVIRQIVQLNKSVKKDQHSFNLFKRLKNDQADKIRIQDMIEVLEHDDQNNRDDNREKVFDLMSRKKEADLVKKEVENILEGFKDDDEEDGIKAIFKYLESNSK